jgi:hypothetical protein
MLSVSKYILQPANDYAGKRSKYLCIDGLRVDNSTLAINVLESQQTFG